ncbi:hypothetical protein ACFPAF_20290 [Hymenobacter endophyticus]|uniref:Uncharacterized protein n=1 Tax=Hymenobacter endophyticus TaxID=3076335 RepID=A0ABU3TNI1_9BACT|nr:hypothetical protein [Hymenobacter endophyticus]MDU0372750.1 hypothetical protein [Hymenobacter endophyticus]
MTNHLLSVEETVAAINAVYPEDEWLELTVLDYSDDCLTVAVCEDLTYYHSLEISLQEVDFMSVPALWQKKAAGHLLQLLTGTAAREFNIAHRITGGNQLFSFSNADAVAIIVAAQKITYRVGSVYYYNRENLLPNERIRLPFKRSV